MPQAKWLEEYSGQSVDELIALAAQYRIDSIVLAFEHNGGHQQFFLNTPEYAPHIVDALKRIDCPRTASIAASAIVEAALDAYIRANRGSIRLA